VAKANKAVVPPPVKKKVKPFPFEGRLMIGAAQKPVEILALAKEGLIAKIENIIVHVGEFYQIQFELPVLEKSVNTQVRVLKTYDKALDVKAKTVERMAEFRFLNLSEDHKNHIYSFLMAIGHH
jgi:hypothetical protein